MANLLLTEACVRKCPYCFAKQYMDGVEDHSAITFENLVYVLDFLEKSGIKHISLLGGEPLLHPQAAEFIEYLILERNFDVCVFTSGVMSKKLFDPFIDKINSVIINKIEKLRFVVNVNEPRFSPKSELEKVHIFLSSLASVCSLSFNIYRLDFNINFLTEYILKYGLRRHVRFGIANPIKGAGNQYINPCDFKLVTKTLMDGLKKMYELHIYPGLDCGFPMCMFSEDDLGRLYKYTRNGLEFECGPTIDIGPDLMCWSCFPLSDIKRRSLKEFNNYDELYSFFENIQQEYRSEVNGIFQECDTCRNFDDDICSGGCLAHIINAFHKEGSFRLQKLQK